MVLSTENNDFGIAGERPDGGLYDQRGYFRNMFSILGQCQCGGEIMLHSIKYYTSIPLEISRGKKTNVSFETDRYLIIM